MADKTYICIDLKSFYASVECMQRGLDPLHTNLIVADESRTEKTICLAVSPSLKQYHIPGRARLFEVVQKVKEANAIRCLSAPGNKFTGASTDDRKLQADPALEITYITAPPQMAKYMEISTQIYQVYLKYIAPEDIHVYSIDEVFIDVTDYLAYYSLSPKELARKIISDVRETTGITATAGIGTNLYLAKVAMDILAKHIPPDENGVRIAELDERAYRQELWGHRPLTDFWRVGRGYERKLNQYGIYTMGDIARCSIGRENEYQNEELLYQLFGVNAELLIDHAWGWEPCTIKDIKDYRPESRSMDSGQVLQCPYTYEKARIVVKEMADSLTLDLLSKNLVTDQLVLTVGYDIENLGSAKHSYKGEIVVDRYGRKIPKHAHGTQNLERFSSSSAEIREAASKLYDRITDPSLLVRRLNLSACHVLPANEAKDKEDGNRQLELFTDWGGAPEKEEKKKAALEKEKKMQQAMLSIKNKFGKNAILKGMNLQEGATARDRNEQVGGHKA